MKSVAALIPAYNPASALVSLVKELAGSGRFREIIVVDDGSRTECGPLFAHLASLPGVCVLRHAVNLGKGAALKTGLNYFSWAHKNCIGLVTADADGQHLAHDVIRIADRLEESPDCLVLGTREFCRDVPLRSRFGNILTKYAFWGLIGKKLSDTQSGLRGIPKSFARDLITVKGTGYEFELDMLIQCKYRNLQIVECPIETVYLDDNSSSHFNPLVDSLKIYFVLSRFVLASLITTIFGYGFFFIIYLTTRNILLSEATSRFLCTGINFLLVRQFVFRSEEQVRHTLPRFILLVASMGAVSYALIQTMMQGLGWDVLPSKVVAELLIYVANFAIQRDFIFTRTAASSVETVAVETVAVGPVAVETVAVGPVAVETDAADIRRAA